MERKKVYELSQNQELYFEVNETQRISIIVEEGLAEIRGRELIKNNSYYFTDVKTSIFTFTGCRLIVEDHNDPEISVMFIKVSSSIPAIFALFHKIKDFKNYNILLLGDGSNNLAITIANFFIRYNGKVQFTEINPAAGNIFPGCLSTMIVETLTDESFVLNNPFCLFYGSTNLKNTVLFDSQLKVLQEKINSLQEEEPLVNLILGFECEDDILEKILIDMKIDEITVISNERFYNKIKVSIEKTFIPYVEYLTANNISRSIRRYFHGTNDSPLISSRIILNRNSFTIVKLGETIVAPDSALPLGVTRKIEASGLVEVDLIENNVMAIAGCDNKEKILQTPVLGFITCIDEKKGRILACQPKMPKNCNYLIQGDISYIDF